MNLARRLEKIEQLHRVTETGRLVFRLSDFGGPLAFEPGEQPTDELLEIARDRLEAEGKIRRGDRERVVFLYRKIVEPPDLPGRMCQMPEIAS